MISNINLGIMITNLLLSVSYKLIKGNYAPNHFILLNFFFFSHLFLNYFCSTSVVNFCFYVAFIVYDLHILINLIILYLDSNLEHTKWYLGCINSTQIKFVRLFSNI